MAILDDLSDYEFEDLMEDVFRNLGYENVRQTRQTAETGRDILMEEIVDGHHRAVVVACEHAKTVDQGPVETLHSVVKAHDTEGPVRGMVVTTGRFTDAACEYVDDLGSRRDGGIELLDGTDISELSDGIGMDLYNGRIEINCEEALRPMHPTAGRDAPVFDALQNIENLESVTVPTPETTVSLEPMVAVHAKTSATFETAAGVVHQVDETDDLVLHAGSDSPRIADDDVRSLVSNRSAPRVDLESVDLERTFDGVDFDRFSQTETRYKQWAIDRVQQTHSTTVHYTGENNLDYEKDCTPRPSDISIWSIDPVYAPHVRSTLSLGEYTYDYSYYAAGPSRATTTNEFAKCVHCGTADPEETYTYCPNCGSINCDDHIETERLESEPVCRGCAVTERFAFRTMYFYSEANAEAFSEEYAAMSIQEKATENVPLVAGTVLSLALAVFTLALVLSLGLL